MFLDEYDELPLPALTYLTGNLLTRPLNFSSRTRAFKRPIRLSSTTKLNIKVNVIMVVVSLTVKIVVV